MDKASSASEHSTAKAEAACVAAQGQLVVVAAAAAARAALLPCLLTLSLPLLPQTVCCGQTYREAEGITKASRQRLRESRASISARHKKKVNSSTIEIRVV